MDRNGESVRWCADLAANLYVMRTGQLPDQVWVSSLPKQATEKIEVDITGQGALSLELVKVDWVPKRFVIAVNGGLRHGKTEAVEMPNGHVMGQVIRNGSGSGSCCSTGRRLIPKAPEQVDVLAVVEGHVLDVRCSICEDCRTWVPGEEAIQKLIGQIEKMRGITIVPLDFYTDWYIINIAGPITFGPPVELSAHHRIFERCVGGRSPV